MDEADDTRVTLAEPLLTAEDVAALLAVPQSSVYDYARRQHDPMPSVEIGRHRASTAPTLSRGSRTSVAAATDRRASEQRAGDH